MQQMMPMPQPPRASGSNADASQQLRSMLGVLG